MKSKKISLLLMLVMTFAVITACSSKSKNSEENNYTLTSSSKTVHEDIRLSFNSIHLASAASNFEEGSTLSELESLYGQANSHEQIPAGDVTLEAYTWNFDEVSVSVQFYNDSAIGRAISHFEFARTKHIDKKKYQQLSDGINYSKVIEILGEPDVLSETVDSEKEEIFAVWTSGIESDIENPSISLTFTNNALTKKEQIGFKQ